MTFQYHEPTSLGEVFALLQAHGTGARLLAGGTDLLVQLNRRLVAPEHVISLARVPDLERLDGGEWIEIGARVPHRAIERSPLFAGALRALPEACATVGSVQIRNAGTVGGNLCNASPAADTPPVLLSLAAQVRLAGPAGERVLPLDQFFLSYRQTALRPDEVLLSVRILAPGPRTGTAFVKLGRRKAMEISIACAGARLTLAEDMETIAEAGIGLGAVAPTPLRARRAEAALRGVRLTPEALAEAGRLAAAECSPITDLRATAEYRRMVAGALVERALARCADRARAAGPGEVQA